MKGTTKSVQYFTRTIQQSAMCSLCTDTVTDLRTNADYCGLFQRTGRGTFTNISVLSESNRVHMSAHALIDNKNNATTCSPPALWRQTAPKLKLWLMLELHLLLWIPMQKWNVLPIHLVASCFLFSRTNKPCTDCWLACAAPLGACLTNQFN